MSGSTFVDPSVAGKLFAYINVTKEALPSAIDEIRMADLTEREMEILRLLGQGRTNEQIAGLLHLSVGTVRNYVSRLFSKLNATDRTQVALIAVRYGLMTAQDLYTDET